jgi:formate dehydrogenase major subunit
MELLLADAAIDPQSECGRVASAMGLAASRFLRSDAHTSRDNSHPGIAIDLSKCIHCMRCVQACREVEVNNVIGMAGRSRAMHVVFDFGDPMGRSTCVSCGSCAQSRHHPMPESVDSLCPYCGVVCQARYHLTDGHIAWAEGIDGPSNRGRLCVKGRFGWDYAFHSDRLTAPLVRREDAPKTPNSTDPRGQFRDATWAEALDRAAMCAAWSTLRFS